MPIDTSIYGRQKDIVVNGPLDVQAKADSLASIGLQNQKMAQEMQMNQQQSDIAKQKRQLLEIGSTYDRVMGLPEKDREAAWNDSVQRLVAAGHLEPKDALPYSPENAALIGQQLNSSPDYLALQKSRLELSSAKNDPLDRELSRGKIKAETAKLYAEAGAASRKAEQEKQPNQTQFQAATFGTRANQAENVFEELAKKGFDPTSNGNTIKRDLPGFLEGFKGEDVKRQEQAERNFVNAILRRESGAAISEGEFKNAQAQYFPRYGDTPEVLKQKEENRKTAIASLQAEGAPALPKIAQTMSGMTVGASVPSKKSSAVIPDAQAGTMPKPGEVEDGYVYMGGDRANPKSWKKVK